jgi:HEAT repeat protein
MSRLWKALPIALAVLAMASGCEREDPSTCEYWVKRLDHPAKTKEALAQVTTMECKEAAEKVKAIFDEGQYQMEALQAIRAIGDQAAAADMLGRALRIKSIGSRAAAIIGEMKLEAARPGLEEVLTTPRNPDAREAALTALLEITPDKKVIEDTLIKVLEQDPAIQGIRVSAVAAEALGELKSEKAIPALIRGAFIRTAQKQEIYGFVRMALARIGKPAVEPLIQAISGEYEPLNSFVATKNIPRWQWQEGPKLAQLLGDLRDKRAADAVAKNLTADLVKVEGLTEAMQEEWIRNMTNRLVVGMVSLGQIGSDSPVEMLGKAIPNQNERDTSQRLNAATALAFIATDKADAAMMAAYAAEQDYRMKAALLLPLAMALDNEHMQVWTDMVEYTKARKKGQEETYYEQQVLIDQLEDADVGPRLATYVAVVAECKDNATCYLSKLKSEDLAVRMKAALMLLRGIAPGEDTFNAMFDAYKVATIDELDLRRFLLMGMGRYGSKAKSGQVLQYADALKARGKGENYWADEMRILGYYLDGLDK